MISKGLRLRLLLIVVVVGRVAAAFVLPKSSLTPTATFCETNPRMALSAKKKRRRRRVMIDNEEETETDAAQNDELPDFELNDGDEDAISSKPKRRRPVNPDEITANMMGRTTSSSVRSISELLQDRQLESKFEFDDDDEVPDASLPDLAELVGKNRSPKEQRKQDAIARAAAAKASEKEPLQLPFEMTNEKGEIRFTKVLEAGAWLGIGLLILWEVYLNSPLFDRAAPLAPIVYESQPVVK